MIKLMEVAAAAALIAGGASGVAAQGFNGAAQIARGDYRAAEHDLVAQRRLYPDDIELMINLATVYINTGRIGAARVMYQAVAAQPDEDVLLAGRPAASSHALAEAALRQLPIQMASR